MLKFGEFGSKLRGNYFKSQKYSQLKLYSHFKVQSDLSIFLEDEKKI